jgi:hypothetical protein
MSIGRHDPFSLTQIMMSDLLLGMILLLCTCWVHNMVTLSSWLVSLNFSICYFMYVCSLYNFTSISLHMVKCSWRHTPSHLFCIVFCLYWACWYDVFYCLFKLLTLSAFAICFHLIFVTWYFVWNYIAFTALHCAKGQPFSLMCYRG